jgi:hypothetical protein
MKTALLLAALALQLPVHAAPTWITNVRLVSPEKLDRIEKGSVLVDGERIIRVERGAGRKPAGATVVDGKGYFLTPGLIDSHVHLHQVPGMVAEPDAALRAMSRTYFEQMPRSYLYHGFTTLVDLAIADDKVIADFNAAPLHPQLLHCGQPLVLANGYPMSYMPAATRFEQFPNFVSDTLQGAVAPAKYAASEHTVQAGVARVKQAGGICAKAHFEHGFGRQANLPVWSKTMFGQVRDEASKAGLTLVMHANSFEAQSFAVEGKADVIAHGMWHWGELNRAKSLPPEIKALLDTMVERGTGVQSTLQVLQGLRAYFEPGYLDQPALKKVVPASLLAWFRTTPGQWFKEELAEGEADDEILQGMAVPVRRGHQVLAYLASKDANLLVGSDTPSSPSFGNLPGLNGALEMRQMHGAGVSLAQLFKAATINNARAFKVDGQVGTIEAGKLANLLLMKRSPLETVDAYDSIVTVWVGGKAVARETLAADRGK